MTEVEGPPVPLVRLSSLLPIRGANARAADGSCLEADCNMAQTFEIPHGNRTTFWAPPRFLRDGATRQVPATLSRSPLAGRNGPRQTRLSDTNMGPEPVRRKRVIRHPLQGRFPVRRSGQG